MSPDSAAEATSPSLLHGSPARTVFRRRSSSGEAVVVKVFAAGSPADAERECAFGTLAAGPGVVDYLGTGLDEASQRPCVTLRHLDGADLDTLVGAAGALPAALACRLLAEVASTLARLHALRCREAPRGLCHGDVKPKNLLRTLSGVVLLDFEHAAPIGTPVAFDGGGSGPFAPPELVAGTPRDAAQDVYGVGASLRFLLDGGGATLPRAHAVDELLASCCAREPERRPTAAELALALQRLAAAFGDDPAESVLHDWASGACASAPAATPAHDDARTQPWHDRARLLRRCPELFATAALPNDPDGIRRDLARAAAVLRRFPREPRTLRRRSELVRAAGRLLADAAAHVSRLSTDETFDAAEQWLVALRALLAHVRTLPGGSAGMLQQTSNVGLLQLDPDRFLQRLQERVADARADLAARLERITAAERGLDLRAAEQALEAMAAERGGTAPTAARRRDQLHRLAFYVDRVTHAAPNVERVVAAWDGAALRPLTQLVALAEANVPPTRNDAATGGVGLRSLQLTLSNLAEEFPHVELAQPAHEALSQALVHLTEQAWQTLADADRQLRSVPVPVRPLQLALGRLDTFRILEAFVDLPERPRSALLDGLERLRLGLEQARSARDQLAKSAESALSRGHWTTGLFDMERALAGIDDGDSDGERAEAQRLTMRLHEAKRRKEQLEVAVRRNVELTARYAALEDDPDSTAASRVQVLEERRDCLLLLAMHVPQDRALLYRQDLRTVETQLVLEQAAGAEQRLDATEDPTARLAIARATLERLTSSTVGGDPRLDPPGRIVRLTEHWRTVAQQCERVLAEAEHAARQRQRQRRRLLWFVAAAAVVLGAAIFYMAVRTRW